MEDINKTLETRRKTYGAYKGTARIAQNIKRDMECGVSWDDLTDDKKESLHMIANKIGRILNGDPNYIDSWHDIAGYAKLIEDDLSE